MNQFWIQVLGHFANELTDLYEETQDRCSQVATQPELACHLLTSFGVGYHDLRQFAPRLNGNAITRLREQKILSTCMFNLDGERTEIPLERGMIFNKETHKDIFLKYKKTYMSSVVSLFLDAQRQLDEVANRAGVAIRWAAASVVQFGNPIDVVYRQLDRLSRLRWEMDIRDPTAFFVETMEQSRQILLSDHNDPEMQEDGLHPVKFLQVGQHLVRRVGTPTANLPKVFRVTELEVSPDGEILGARNEEGNDLGIKALLENYGLREAQKAQEVSAAQPMAPRPIPSAVPLSDHLRKAVVDKLTEGQKLNAGELAALKLSGLAYNNTRADAPLVLEQLRGAAVVAEDAPVKPAPVQKPSLIGRIPVSAELRPMIMLKLQEGARLNAGEIGALTLAGITYKPTAAGMQQALEMLQQTCAAG